VAEATRASLAVHRAVGQSVRRQVASPPAGKVAKIFPPHKGINKRLGRLATR